VALQKLSRKLSNRRRLSMSDVLRELITEKMREVIDPQWTPEG
jgi:predicted CopG family antitoxin